MISPANWENELHEKLNAPSIEDQKEKLGKDIEKAISDRMIVMREIVVRTPFPRFLDSRTRFSAENCATR